MPCYDPIHGYKARRLNANGKRPIVFNVTDGFKDMPVTLPCGKCDGCKLERARQWSIRIMHEASLYQDNCFITLTYNHENIPPGGSLSFPKYAKYSDIKTREVKKRQYESSDFQLFMKRLRKRYAPTKIRFFQAGEYGAKKGRPHYHAILFNFDFPDKELWRHNELKQPIWRSEALEELWPLGFSEIGSVTVESAGYVARYCTKKVYGDEAFEHYNIIDPDTGEILNEKYPEHTTMSRGGRHGRGIGYDWYKKYSGDVFPKDFITVNGIKHMPPNYYSTLYELENPDEFARIKERRLESFEERQEDLTPERLVDRLKVKKAQTHNLKRSYENGE